MSLKQPTPRTAPQTNREYIEQLLEICQSMEEHQVKSGICLLS